MPKIIIGDMGDRIRAIDIIRDAPIGASVEICGPTRTVKQNDMIWAMMREIADQKPRGFLYPATTWKGVFMSGFGIELEFVRGLYDEPVAHTLSTSKLSRGQAAEFIEFTRWWCADNGVNLTDRDKA